MRHKPTELWSQVVWAQILSPHFPVAPPPSNSTLRLSFLTSKMGVMAESASLGVVTVKRRNVYKVDGTVPGTWKGLSTWELPPLLLLLAPVSWSCTDNAALPTARGPEAPWGGGVWGLDRNPLPIPSTTLVRLPGVHHGLPPGSATLCCACHCPCLEVECLSLRAWPCLGLKPYCSVSLYLGGPRGVLTIAIQWWTSPKGP